MSNQTSQKPLPTISTPPARAQKPASFDSIRQYGLLLALALLIIGFSFTSEYFLTASNLINVARQMSITAIVSVGMTLVIINGGIDLSVGSVVAFTGIIATDTLARTGSVMFALTAGVLAGGAIGFINGFISAYGKIAGFITTLATMQGIRGLGYIYTGGNPISANAPAFTKLGTGSFAGLPIPIWIMCVVVLVGYLLLNKTRFGRYVYAIGGNEQGSKWSGLPVPRIQMSVYALCGVFAGLAGVILSARLGSGQPGAGTGFELDVITAVILGGTSLAGGRGKISGTFVGVTIVAVLGNGLTLLNVSSYWQMVIKGAIIVAAVYIDSRIRSKDQ